MTNLLHKNSASSFNDFEDDRMTDQEMFDAIGGIEQNEMVKDATVYSGIPLYLIGNMKIKFRSLSDTIF